MAKSSLILMISIALCGCASNRDWSGKWQPINRLDDVPHTLSLRPLREFHATPIDRTLRGVLERWARESGMMLDWQLAEDYTLTKLTTTIRDASLPEALRRLNAIYAAQHISLSVVEGTIIATIGPVAAELTTP